MGREEHYFSPSPAPPFEQAGATTTSPNPVSSSTPPSPPIPTQAPLIIVTATGGGLHASAWTAEVLDHLEEQFDQQYPDAKGTFHKHLLLASTVSGGSIGLLTYLAALHQKTPGESLDFQSMRTTAQCSSLEAVGWGLVYWDMSKAIVPVIPYFWKPSSGLDDLDPHSARQRPHLVPPQEASPATSTTTTATKPGGATMAPTSLPFSNG